MESHTKSLYQMKTKGNHLFKTGNIEEASGVYLNTLLKTDSLLKSGKIPPSESRALIGGVRTPCLLNLSACYLSLGYGYEEAIIHCTEVLHLEKHNLKAFYRRAQAQFSMRNYKESLLDIIAA